MFYDIAQLTLNIVFYLILLVSLGLFTTACVRATLAQAQQQKEEELARYRAAAAALSYLLKHVERTADGYSLSVEVMTQARRMYRQLA